MSNELARKLQHLCWDVVKSDFDLSVIKDRFLEVKDITATGMPPLIAAVTAGRLAWVDFINILCTAFTHADLKSVKKTDLTVFFAVLGSA
jgi:hypothetical protein